MHRHHTAVPDAVREWIKYYKKCELIMLLGIVFDSTSCMQRLVREYPDRSLTLLPNMIFSMALGVWEAAQPVLAATRRAQAGDASSSSSTGNSRRKKKDAKADAEPEGEYVGDVEADRVLQEPLINAILLHPLALVRLMDK